VCVRFAILSFGLSGGGIGEGVGIGDFNGDGFDDVAMVVQTEPDFFHPHIDVLLILFGRAGFTGTHTADERLDGALRFRVADPLTRGNPTGLAAPGDLDQDGLDEIFFYVWGFEELEGGRGRGFLLYGARGLEDELELPVEAIGPPPLRGVSFVSTDPAHTSVGSAFATIGDFNGDGERDLAVAAPSAAPSGRASAGVVFVIFRSRDLPARVDLAEVGAGIPGFRIEGYRAVFGSGGSRGTLLGTDLVAAGDVDGDGLADLLVNAPNAYPGTRYLVHGTRTPPPVLDLLEHYEGRHRSRGGSIAKSSCVTRSPVSGRACRACDRVRSSNATPSRSPRTSGESTSAGSAGNVSRPRRARCVTGARRRSRHLEKTRSARSSGRHASASMEGALHSSSSCTSWESTRGRFAA
jgi:hypothetical protein